VGRSWQGAGRARRTTASGSRANMGEGLRQPRRAARRSFGRCGIDPLDLGHPRGLRDPRAARGRARPRVFSLDAIKNDDQPSPAWDDGAYWDSFQNLQRYFVEECLNATERLGAPRPHSGAPLDEPTVHGLMRLVGAVMESAEPLVERNRAVGVVALEVLVMEVVSEAVGIAPSSPITTLSKPVCPGTGDSPAWKRWNRAWTGCEGTTQ
jgi:hypothetical protein